MRYMTLMTLFSSSFWALLAAVPLQPNNYQIISDNYLIPDSETHSNDAHSSSYELNPLIRASGQVSAVRIRRDATTEQFTSPKKAQFEKSKKSFEKDCLRAHNKWRKLHGAPELKFDRKVTAFSQKRADFIAASDGDKFEHPPNLPFGENLAWHSNEKTSCHDLIKMWYDEIKLHDFSNPKFSMETGHFTQLVWKGTERLGCAASISTGPKGGIFLVCNYDPPGNYLGEFEQNVLPARGSLESESGTTATTTTTVATTTNRLPTTTANAIIQPNVKPNTTTRPNVAATVISSTTTITEATTSTSITTKRPDKKKKNKKNKSKKKKNQTDKDKNKKKKKKKGNKKKKNKKKATSSTTSTTTTTTTTTELPI